MKDLNNIKGFKLDEIYLVENAKRNKKSWDEIGASQNQGNGSTVIKVHTNLNLAFENSKKESRSLKKWWEISEVMINFYRSICSRKQFAKKQIANPAPCIKKPA